MSVQLIYTLDPNGYALWLPAKLCAAISVQRGERLTRDQYADPRVKSLIDRRREAKPGSTPLE